MKKIALFLCLLLFSMISFSHIKADESSKIISLEKAEQIAILHIAGDMQNNIDESWSLGIRVSNSITMYDLEDKPSCYMFELKDKEENPCGYIVIGATTDYYPVIEFSTTGESFARQAEKILTEEVSVKENTKASLNKFYYIGGMNYLAELKDENGIKYVYDVSTSEINELDAESIKTQTDVIFEMLQETQEINKAAWEKWDEVIASSSNPPTSGGAITNPGAYESGYDVVYTANVLGYNRQYNSMGKFKSAYSWLSNHCGPTAASNVMVYWYLRDTTKYRALYDNNQWYSAFLNELHPDIYCPEHNTNHIEDVERGIKLYFNRRNLSVSTDIDSWVWWSDIQGEIQNNYPLITLTKGHYWYGNHYVFTVGYKDYVYKHWYGDNHSRYLRIYDGWDSTGYPNRYIHTEVGVDTIKIVQIRPN